MNHSDGALKRMNHTVGAHRDVSHLWMEPTKDASQSKAAHRVLLVICCDRSAARAGNGPLGIW